MTTNQNLLNVCEFIQRMDRNSDIMQAYKEYQNEELPKEILVEICNNVLTDWYYEGLTDEDVTERKEIQMYLNLIK